jgi:hypothetical protein
MALFFGLHSRLTSQFRRSSRLVTGPTDSPSLPRRAIAQASLALPAAASGAVAQLVATPAMARAAAVSDRGTAGFGWEIADLHNNRAVATYAIGRSMIIDSMYLDAATMITKAPERAGFCEVLITVDLRDRQPELIGPQRDQLPPVPNTEIGKGEIYNPNGLRSIAGVGVSQGAIARMILKTWVSQSAIGSSAGRNARTEPRLLAHPGHVIVFFLGHAGIPCDAEIQAVMCYTVV